MKGFVITIEDLPQSVSVAERCKKSAEKFGLSTELFPAITPRANYGSTISILRMILAVDLIMLSQHFYHTIGYGVSVPAEKKRL